MRRARGAASCHRWVISANTFTINFQCHGIKVSRCLSGLNQTMHIAHCQIVFWFLEHELETLFFWRVKSRRRDKGSVTVYQAPVSPENATHRPSNISTMPVLSLKQKIAAPSSSSTPLRNFGNVHGLKLSIMDTHWEIHCPFHQWSQKTMDSHQNVGPTGVGYQKILLFFRPLPFFIRLIPSPGSN